MLLASLQLIHNIYYDALSIMQNFRIEIPLLCHIQCVNILQKNSRAFMIVLIFWYIFHLTTVRCTYIMYRHTPMVIVMIQQIPKEPVSTMLWLRLMVQGPDVWSMGQNGRHSRETTSYSSQPLNQDVIRYTYWTWIAVLSIMATRHSSRLLQFYFFVV